MEQRKRRTSGRAGGASAAPDRLATMRERAGERDAAARAALAPLAPGERPRALLAAIAIAGALGGANAIAYAAGATIGGKHPSPAVLAFTALMWALAAGMWTRRYVAVLAFEALLALIVVFFTLLLTESANVLAFVVCVVVIGGAGWLFWKLVRVMGRLAVPPADQSSSG